MTAAATSARCYQVTLSRGIEKADDHDFGASSLPLLRATCMRTAALAESDTFLRLFRDCAIADTKKITSEKETREIALAPAAHRRPGAAASVLRTEASPPPWPVICSGTRHRSRFAKSPPLNPSLKIAPGSKTAPEAGAKNCSQCRWGGARKPHLPLGIVLAEGRGRPEVIELQRLLAADDPRVLQHLVGRRPLVGVDLRARTVRDSGFRFGNLDFGF